MLSCYQCLPIQAQQAYNNIILELTDSLNVDAQTKYHIKTDASLRQYLVVLMLSYFELYECDTQAFTQKLAFILHYLTLSEIETKLDQIIGRDDYHCFDSIYEFATTKVEK